jgi:predicted TIM-barrel fold metal-dependent hydrolase
MFNGIGVIDSDGHVMEPDTLYDEYLERKFFPMLEELKAQKERLQARNFFGIFQQLDTGQHLGRAQRGKSLRRAGRRPHGISTAAAKIVIGHTRKFLWRELADKRGGCDPQIRIKDMDREGIDVAVLFATAASSFCILKTLDFEIAMIKAYHRWLKDYCMAFTSRLCGVAVVPMRDPARAADMIENIAKEKWAVGVYLSGHIGERLLDDPSLHPIWRACENNDLPACFHGGVARPPYGLGTFDLCSNLFLQHAAINPFESMRAIAALIGGGVLELFPKLRVVFLEAGTGWLPFWAERLDDHFELMREYVPLLTRKPSEAIHSENFFISCDPDEAFLPVVTEYIGAEHLLYASDYPHFDGRFPFSVKLTVDRPEFDADTRRKILWHNPKRLYSRIDASSASRILQSAEVREL